MPSASLAGKVFYRLMKRHFLQILLILLIYSCNQRINKNQLAKDSISTIYQRDQNTSDKLHVKIDTILRNSNGNDFGIELSATLNGSEFKILLNCNSNSEVNKKDTGCYLNQIELFEKLDKSKKKIPITNDLSSFKKGIENMNYDDFNLNNIKLGRPKTNHIEKYIHIEDYNLDGHDDLSIYCPDCTGNAGSIYYTWLYDDLSKSFVFDTTLSSLDIKNVDKSAKTITLTWRFGANDGFEKVYKIVNGKFQPYELISKHSKKDSTGDYTVTIDTIK